MKGMVIHMTAHLIAMTSITYAMKAQTMLKSMGYNCEIQKTPKSLSTGCGYSIRVQNDAEEILSVLKQNDIPYKAVDKAGEIP